MSYRAHQNQNAYSFSSNFTSQSDKYSCNSNDNLVEAVGFFSFSVISVFIFASFAWKVAKKFENSSLLKKSLVIILFAILPIIFGILTNDSEITKIVSVPIFGFIAGIFWYKILSYIFSFLFKPKLNHYLTLIVISIPLLANIEWMFRRCEFSISGAYTGFILFMLIFHCFGITSSRGEKLRTFLKIIKEKIIKITFISNFLGKIHFFFNTLNVQQKIIINITGFILVSMLTFVLTEGEFSVNDGTWFLWFLNFGIIGFFSYNFWSDKK